MHVPLSQILTVGRPPAQSVAVQNRDTISFDRFQSDVALNAARLKQCNCRVGAPVSRDSYWFLVGFLALCHAGASIVIPSNTRPGTLQSLSRDCGLLLVADHVGNSDEFLLMPSDVAPPHVEPFDPRQIRVDFFTSGSTGSPKRVERTVYLLEREVDLVAPALSSVSSGGLVSGMVSHLHIYGMMFRLLWPLATGRPFSSATHEIWETLLDELEPGGVLVTSPAHLSRLAGIAALPAERRPNLILSAGAALSDDSVQDAARLLGTYPTEIFGSTETGAFAIRGTQTGNSVWQPFSGVHCGVTDAGTLKVQSPAVKAHRWEETSDVVDVFHDGGFRFLGRVGSIVKIEGKRVSLPEVEYQLANMDWIETAAVLMVDIPRKCMAAVVVTSQAGRELLEEMGAFRFSRMLRQELAHTQEPAVLPRQWRFVDALPVGDMGKRKKKDLADLFTHRQK